jgi:hypothetical protein
VASHAIPHTIPFLLTIDETFDIGSDLRTPVDDADYQVPFRFTGTLGTVTVNLGPVQLGAADQRRMREARAQARDWGESD